MESTILGDGVVFKVSRSSYYRFISALLCTAEAGTPNLLGGD